MKDAIIHRQSRITISSQRLLDNILINNRQITSRLILYWINKRANHTFNKLKITNTIIARAAIICIHNRTPVTTGHISHSREELNETLIAVALRALRYKLFTSQISAQTLRTILVVITIKYTYSCKQQIKYTLTLHQLSRKGKRGFTKPFTKLERIDRYYIIPRFRQGNKITLTGSITSIKSNIKHSNGFSVHVSSSHNKLQIVVGHWQHCHKAHSYRMGLSQC